MAAGNHRPRHRRSHCQAGPATRRTDRRDDHGRGHHRACEAGAYSARANRARDQPAEDQHRGPVPARRLVAGAGRCRSHLCLRPADRPARDSHAGGRSFMKSKLLVIDDDAAIRDTMRMLLEYDGYEVVVAASGQEGLAMVEKENPDLVFLDVKMPGMDGLEVLGRLRTLNDALPVVIVSAHGNTTTALEAGRLGAFRFVEKPLSKDYVLDAVREGLELGNLRRENRQLRSALETRHQVVGESGGLRAVMDQVGRAAPTSATVLILGESGVGKELIARSIHRNSLRAKERFVQVNCAAIPEELIESELFGHERGAFTGATEKLTGKFEQADRGTIFLDEVGDMSPKTQAKVLRVLQEGEVERLGSARTIKVDVRVIAATYKNLEEEIEKDRKSTRLNSSHSQISYAVFCLKKKKKK